MKSVLISIHPKWCDLIIRGKKTLELRSSCPCLKPPFQCYLYCTKSGATDKDSPSSFQRGFVIAEFLCRQIEPFSLEEGETSPHIKRICKNSCVSFRELADYAEDGSLHRLFAWHISDVQVFSAPLAVTRFSAFSEQENRPCQSGKRCEYEGYDFSENTSICTIDYDGRDCPKIKLRRPPQSWRYVESI